MIHIPIAVALGVVTLTNSFIRRGVARDQLAASCEQQLASRQQLQAQHERGLAWERERFERTLQADTDRESRQMALAVSPLRHPLLLADDTAPTALRVIVVPPQANTVTGQVQDAVWSDIHNQGLRQALSWGVQQVLQTKADRQVRVVDPSVLNPVGLRGEAAVRWLQQDPNTCDIPVLWVQIDRVNRNEFALSTALWGPGRRSDLVQLGRIPCYSLARMEARTDAGQATVPEGLVAEEAMQLLTQCCLMTLFAAADAHYLAGGLPPLLPQVLHSELLETERLAVRAATQGLMMAYAQAAESVAASDRRAAEQIWLALAEYQAAHDVGAAKETLRKVVGPMAMLHKLSDLAVNCVYMGLLSKRHTASARRSAHWSSIEARIEIAKDAADIKELVDEVRCNSRSPARLPSAEPASSTVNL